MSTQTPTQDKTKLRAAPRMSFGRWITQLGWRHAITIAAVMFALFPITYIIGVALNPVGSLSSACPPSKTGISALSCLVIPQTVSFENFSAIFNDPRLPYGTWFVNSLTVALVAAIFSTLMSASAAFAFSRLRFKGRRPGLLSLVLLQMFPQILAITAIFILMTKISEVFPQFGSGTVTGLILIYLGGSLGVNTYLIKGFFDTVPIEIDESAKIDGASHVRIFFGLVLPFGAGHGRGVLRDVHVRLQRTGDRTDLAAEHDRHHPGGGHADLRVGQPAGVGQVRRGCAAGSHSDDHGLRLHAAVPPWSRA